MSVPAGGAILDLCPAKIVHDELVGGRSFGAERPLADGGIRIALDVRDRAFVIDRHDLGAAYRAVGADAGNLFSCFDRNPLCILLYGTHIGAQAHSLRCNGRTDGSCRDLQKLPSGDFHGWDFTSLSLYLKLMGFS